jgi:hypothetical protein
MTREGELSISVRLHARDVRWAARRYLFSWRGLATPFLLLCSSVASAIKGQPLMASVFLALAPALFIIVPLISAVTAMRNPAMQSAFHHTFSDTGILSRFLGGSLQAEWSLIRNADESPRYFAIQAKRGGLPMLVPKDQLTEADISALRRVLKLHLQANAKLLASN